jgi:hypothetical protein
VPLVGVIGGVAPADPRGGQSGPMRVTYPLARVAPALLRGVFRLQLRAVRRGGEHARERMAAWATFYPSDAHLSVPLGHQDKILGAFAVPGVA